MGCCGSSNNTEKYLVETVNGDDRLNYIPMRNINFEKEDVKDFVHQALKLLIFYINNKSSSTYKNNLRIKIRFRKTQFLQKNLL